MKMDRSYRNAMKHLWVRKAPKRETAHTLNTLNYVIVTFPLFWRDIVAKTTYRRKHFIKGLFTVSESESMIIMTRSMAASWQAWRWSSIHKHDQCESQQGVVWAFETSKPFPTGTPPSTRLHFPIFTDQSIKKEPYPQMEPMESILIQTTTYGMHSVDRVDKGRDWKVFVV